MVEETVEGRVREALGSGRITREWLHEQIAAWDEAHPDDKLLNTGTEQNLIEAVSTLGKAYFAGKIKDGQLPQPIAHFFRQLSAIFRQFFIRATKLKQSLKDGTLSPEFEAMLEESLGFYSEQRTAQKEAHAISDFTEFNTFSLSPDNKAILQGEPVARTSTKDVPIIGGKIIESAVAWIRANPQPNARTVIGSVRISPDGVQTSFSHTRYPNKLAVLPKLTKILERAAYLGSAPDWKRKDATDHYFAAPVEIDNVKRIVFIRVIAEQGNSAALQVHEIYTLEEIEKAGALTPSQVQPPPRGVQTSATAGAIGPMSDLYRSLVKGGLIVNSNTEKAANKDGQPLASGDYNASELSNDLSFSLAPDAKPYDTIPSPTGHEDWAVFTKWDAEKSKGKVKALPIQVLAGKHFGPHRGFGFRHILSEHEGDFAARGIKNQRQFIHRILLDFDEAYSEGGRVTLVANRPKSVAVVELREEKGGFYSVVTAFPKENPAWKPRGERILSGRKAAFAQSGRAPTPTAQGQTSLKPPLEPLVGKDSWEYLRQLSTPVKDSGGTTFSISGQVDHQKISSILNGTYEATTEDHLAARSFERSIRQDKDLLREFGGHVPKARPISHLETKECQIGAAIGAVFQKRVGLFDTGDVTGPGGFYSPSLPDLIFLNQNSEFSHLGTGHELWHALTVEDRTTARRIGSLIEESIDAGRWDSALRKFEQAYGDQTIDEVAANIFGTVLVDPRFWQELRTPYATEIADALRALPKNAAYDEANLIKDWPTFVKEVANLLRPKEQNPQQRSLLSDPSSTGESNVPGKPESSFSLSDEKSGSKAQNSNPVSHGKTSVPDHGGKLLAPNGEPSNLSTEQWHLVRTPEFKQWFGDWEALAKQTIIDDFIHQALHTQGNPSQLGEVVFRNVTAKEAAEVTRQGGPDITGMEHVFKADDLRHAARSHSDVAKESARTPPQRVLSEQDLQMLPVVLDAPDSIIVEKRATNRSSIIYRKTLATGEIAYVERVIETSGNKKPRLVTKTAWVSVATGVKSSPAQVYTPGHDSKLPFANGRVNPETVNKAIDENGEPRIFAP